MSAAYDGLASRSLGPNYRKLWSSSAVSNLADGIFVVALPLIAVRLTDSPMLVAGVSLAGRLPWLGFVLLAGAPADRLDRRVTMRNVQLVRVGVVGLIAVGRASGQALTDLGVSQPLQERRDVLAIRRPQEGARRRCEYRVERCPEEGTDAVWCGRATGSPYQ